jgi:hypothetical protein
MLIAWKTEEKLTAEIRERRPERQPWKRLTVALGHEIGGGAAWAEDPSALAAGQVLFVLEEAEAKAAFGVDLAEFPPGPVKVRLGLEVV